MKAVSVLCMALMFFGCGIIDESWVGQWCYVRSGLYLVYGEPECDTKFSQEKDNWPRVGRVSDVFYAYNTDPEIDLWVSQDFTRSDVLSWLSQGFRVVGYYQNGSVGQNHTVRIKTIERFDALPFFEIVVAGNFNQGGNDRAE